MLRPARAQTEAAHRIDIHHHLTPPDYVAKIGAQGSVPPPSRNWSVAKSLDDMQLAGVTKAMLSGERPCNA